MQSPTVKISPAKSAPAALARHSSIARLAATIALCTAYKEHRVLVAATSRQPRNATYLVKPWARGEYERKRRIVDRARRCYGTQRCHRRAQLITARDAQYVNAIAQLLIMCVDERVERGAQRVRVAVRALEIGIELQQVRCVGAVSAFQQNSLHTARRRGRRG